MLNAAKSSTARVARSSFNSAFLQPRSCCRSSYSTTTSGTSSSSSSFQASPKIPFSQKFSRAVSFSFYSGIVLAGAGLSGLVVYYFVNDILLPTSDVQVYNRAFSIIEKDEEAVKMLGGGRITAYGETSDNKWARNRPVASRRGFDGRGREHLLMQFHAKGELAEGLVRLEMVQSDEKSVTGIGKFDFRYLVLEVPGYKRLYLIDNGNLQPKPKSGDTGFLGVKWGKKE